ncbi:cytochrome P450 [Pseudonocardia sp. N23]|uniref:cytochrome P450 n=1 Tax=Pseudonocardia sp. N23 TaxID=1987376 RepID=UPI000BFDAF7E|nr:cytochrome P450 [Pseudonocardia sp. N23]GAY08317.1 putative cytochrome P450 hydroxylase [Pseudonocardia sp. N23]
MTLAGTSALAELEAHAAGPATGDPYPILARLRAESPVVWSEPMQAWLVTSWAEVTRGFKDADAFGPLASGSGSSAIYGRTILHMTGDEHRRKAAIVARRIRNRRELRGTLRERIGALVEELGADLPAAPGVADIRAGLTTPLPLTVIAELMTMHEAVNFPQWYHDLAAASISNVSRDPAVHDRGVQAREEIDAWLDPAIAGKRAEPGDDLLSDLCTVEYEGQRLADAEIKSNTAFFLAAGIETTDRALVNLLGGLIRHPEQWDRLRADPALVPSAVAEVLRWKAPVQGSVRQARVDTDLGGVAVAAGDKLILLLGAANRDPAVFPDPDTFDVGRFADNADPQFTPVGPLRAFGGGEHTCSGSLLAKLEMELAVEHLLSRYRRLSFAGDPPADAGFMLRSAPSLQLQLHP